MTLHLQTSEAMMSVCCMTVANGSHDIGCALYLVSGKQGPDRTVLVWHSVQGT